MRNLTKYNEDLSIPRKKDVDGCSTATNLENGTGSGALKQKGAVAASGANTTAFGSGTSASASNAHAEGNGTVASGNASHAQNNATEAFGDYSHAEGSSTESSGQAAHAEGTGTVAANRSQHVEGEYNVADPSANEPSGRGTYQHIVGNGTSDSNRSNAHTMDWNGNAWYAGDVYVGSASGTGMDNGSKKLATEEFVTTDYLQKTGDSSETTAAFNQAAARENVASGDKLSVLFGKIAKWFSDLKNVAFSGKSSDLDNDAKFQTKNDLDTALGTKQNVLISSGATVGDLIKVKSVDTNGVPTAWEIAEEGVDYIKSVPVTSVNGDTGAVTLSASDVGAQPTITVNGIVQGDGAGNLSAADLNPAAVGLGNVDNVKQYSATNPPPYPVTSVNSKTGAVTLTASDVGALPSTTEIPTKTSQLENDSGFITSAPVTSVNGDTGAVVLTASDVGAATTGNIQAYLNRTTAVDESNTSYTSYMARGEALYSYETTPSANGCIAWTYE